MAIARSATHLRDRQAWCRRGESAVARREEKCDPLIHRLAKVFWRGSYERSLPVSDDKVFDADELVELAHRVIEKKAQEGNCVIVGRGAPYILRARKDAFHVFVYGSRERKIERLVNLKMREKDATEMVDTIDKERAAFVRKYFNAEWPCRRLYHLMLNSDTASITSPTSCWRRWIHWSAKARWNRRARTCSSIPCGPQPYSCKFLLRSLKRKRLSGFRL